MRDLKRRNARRPAWRMFEDLGIVCFTPMVHRLVTVDGRHEDRKVPIMPDLLFVNDTRKRLDPIVEADHTLQYRFMRGAWQTPVVVRDSDMERFIAAAESTETPVYYRPDEITPAMLSRRIRIVGGVLDGYEGTLVTMRGSKVRRLLVRLPSLLAVSVEVQPEYIELLPDRKNRETAK